MSLNLSNTRNPHNPDLCIVAGRGGDGLPQQQPSNREGHQDLPQYRHKVSGFKNFHKSLDLNKTYTDPA